MPVFRIAPILYHIECRFVKRGYAKGVNLRTTLCVLLWIACNFLGDIRVYRRATVATKTAQLNEYLLRSLRQYLATPNAQQHTQLCPLFLSFLGWLRTLRETRSAATLNAICERVRAMLNWTYEEGLIDQVPLRRRSGARKPSDDPNRPLSWGCQSGGNGDAPTQSLA
jgi:hypothetical protein